ncbi:two-component system sensor histidine kinase VicK [Caldicellulosiruptor bescii]|uniref:histidine kinase n=3 Tax=Caldicellulosiruptor TaxID=44000 RepID=B9MLN3_CALBD|nr:MULTISPECIES: ATP-binding protein [Caldicellulosiruptor]ACM59241.1 PAS/PAC sensor signal transduction histidine kinase [Caldicellulosiruptor bescii DSM 6725]ADQ44979.1 multi-sensor signal transduction histidine kinase [Caldicellulosiruptor kronotskyensis 2002]PBC88301.1 two-component system sensor histidine kinase VicK [Caldicellulosiruptor bescii]PBC92218.1 two-component system sensor histidine kinase VicK [Caldicellulosiruptor bescii]PBD04972.1 two-component system sensor histidine kinase
MTKSIESRLIIVFGLLILILMFISSFFVIDRTKSYFYDDIKNKIEFMVSSSLIRILEDKSLTQQKIQEIIDQSMKQSQYGFMIQKLIVTDNRGRLLASFPRMDISFYPSDEILTSLAGYKVIKRDSENQTMIFAFPIKSGKSVERSLYLEVSCQSILETVTDIKNILFMAYVIGMGFSLFIGFLFAKTLSNPLRKLTRQALEMAQGNLDVKIEISSQDEIGKLASAFKIMATNLKRYITELEFEKQKLERILQNMSDGVLAINSRNEIIHINESAKRFLKDDIHGFLDKIQAQKSSVVSQPIIYEVDGYTLEVSIAFFVDSFQSTGMVFILHDITEQAKLDRMRKQFVADVSHELRTPITTIKTYSETLLDVDDESVKREFLTVIIKECDRMTRLISDLLYLSRLDSGENILRIEEVNISELVRFVCEKMRIHANKKHQSLLCNVQEDIIIDADRDRLEQVLINLINNAITYVQDGGRIEVCLKKENGNIELTVEDNGPGIPKEDLPRIFERFYRVDKARSRSLGGSGLGLSIADEIVKAHGGRVLVESEEGVGTKFTVVLPLKEKGQVTL